ncbi:putative transcriptional regulator [Hyphomonas hirschiana VP5]|nr:MULTISPECIES: FCD domain-containing protein [Hyphomonas]KCZ92553.1 putative transcriptional regulator [Hyphomonas hirschiana VP5]
MKHTLTENQRPAGRNPVGMTAPRKDREKGALKVAREIVRHIYEERIPPGQKYLSEADALERYRVARGTLREALRYLQLQGVLKIRTGPNGGHFVANPQWENLASTIALLLQFSEATIESLIESRIAIEPGMAALAAQRATPDDVRELSDLLDELKLNLGDYDAFYQLYLEFWDQLALTARNPLFLFLLPALRRITWTSGIRPNEAQREAALGGLCTLRDSVAANDPAGAANALRRLEEAYLATMRTEYPRELAKRVVWHDHS